MAFASRKRDDLMPKISKAQSYAIEYLYKDGNTVDFISSDLNLSVKQVQNVIDEKGIGVDNKPTTKQTNTDRDPHSPRIMTQTDSMIADDKRSKYISAHTDQSHIFRPKSK